MRTYKVRPDKTTDGGTCFVAAFDDAPDIGVQGTTANGAVETLLSLAGKLPVTAPTPERRVGEARVAELAKEHPGHIGLATIRDLALDLLDERAANARLTAEVERLRVERDRYLDTLNWAMGTNGYFPGTTVHRPYAWREDMERKAALRYNGEKYVAALSLPTPAPEATDV